MLLLFIIGLLVGLAYLFPAAILGPVGSFLVVNNPQQNSKAIVILLGGESPERVLTAFDLYQATPDQKFVFGSGFKDADLERSVDWPLGGERYRAALLSLGVPDERIVTVDTSSSYDTAGELTAIAAFLEREQITTVTLVSAASHTRRIKAIWHRLAPQRLDGIVAARPERMNNWWQKGRAVREVAYEYGALTKELFQQLRAALPGSS